MTRRAYLGLIVAMAVAGPLTLAMADGPAPKNWREGDARLQAAIEDLQTRLQIAERRLSKGATPWSAKAKKQVTSALRAGAVLKGVATQSDSPEEQLKCTLRLERTSKDGRLAGTIEWASGSDFTGGVTRFRGSLTTAHVSLHEYAAIRQGDILVGTRYLLTTVADGNLVGTWTYVGPEGLFHGSLALRLP